MIQIALSEYLAEIDQLIEDQRFVESIAHCRHILQQHPRHVGTYRMLGKALLEQQNYHDAADVFQRVLSADPEDFIAHVGMSIINKEDTLLPQAVWHMERAHEMDPYNLVIRDELLVLYEQRDERLPRSLTLSRSALARLYARSEMYLLAAAELRQLLAEDENRMDLMTLLAETLWQAGQRVDAVDVCLEILERLPNSIKANAILAEVWLTTGRGEEANEFVDALSRLTLPEAATIGDSGLVATVFATEGAPALPQQQMVHYLDYVPEVEGETEDIVPQWVDELNLVDESAPADPDAAIVDDIPTPLPLTDVPSWFNDLGDEAPAPTEEPPSETSLDWLRDVAVSRSEPGQPALQEDLAAMDEPFAAADDDDDIVDEVMASSSAEDIPDWLGGILEEQDGESLLDSLVGPDRELPEAAELDLEPVDVSADDSDWNDWDDLEVPALAGDAGDDLTWLHEDAAENSAEVDSEGEEFTWLENSASPVVDVSTAAAEEYDWLEVEPEQIESPATPAPVADDLDDFDWLDDGDLVLPSDDEPAETMASADSADNLPDLDELPDMAEEWTFSGSEEHFMDLNDKPGNEDEEFSSESESSSPSAQQSEDGALDWLQDLADAEPTHTGLLRPDADDEPLPDWLTQDMPEGNLAKELPDWLAEDSLVSGSDLSATVTDHEMIVPDVDRGTGDLSQAALPDEPADARADFSEGEALDDDEEISEDLSWLDAMSPVDEPPTLSWADSGVTPAPTEEPPTPPSAQQVPEITPQPEPADEEMGIVDNWQDDTVRMSAEEFAALQQAAGLQQAAESPSDAEIAMDWLDELSDAPEMDLDLSATAAPETEIVASSDPEMDMASEDEAEAMDWLEDLSAEFEIDAGVTDIADVSDDLDLFEESPEPPASGELTWLDELSQPVVDEETGETLLGPDDGSVSASGESVSAKDLDSAEVMAWLDELAELPENEESGTVVDDDLLPDLLGSAVELPVAESEVTQEEDSDAMAWLDQLATEFADEDAVDTAMVTDSDDLLPELADLEEEAEPIEMGLDAPAPPRVIIDGQEIPDLDIEPTEDPLSEADAMAWLEDLIQDEAQAQAEPDTAAEHEPVAEAEPVEMELDAPAPPRVVIDGQEIPDLDIEPTEDPLSEADAMAWLEDLIQEEAAAEAEPETTADSVEEAEPIEMEADIPAPPRVVIDGQEIPDLDIEPTEDPLSEADAMAWLEDLIQDEVSAEAEEESVLAEEPDWSEVGIVDEQEAAAAVETPQVIIDGQVVPDLDIEPTDDPLSEADAMAWLDEFIAEVDQAPQAEAIPEDGIMDVDMVTAVSEPLAPDQPEAEEPEAEMADDGLAALAFLEELALSADLPVADEETAEDTPAIEPAANTATDDVPIISRALPTEPELSLEDLADDIPEDPDEAMDWIRSMAEEEPEAPDDEMDMSWLDAFADETDEAAAVADLSAQPADEADAEVPDTFGSQVVAEQESPFGSLELDNMPIEDLFDLPDGDLPEDIAAQLTQLGTTDALSDDVLAEPDAEPAVGSAEAGAESDVVDLEDLFGDEDADMLLDAAEVESAEDLFDDELVADDLFADLIEAEEEVGAEAELETPPAGVLATDDLAADAGTEAEAVTLEPEPAETPSDSLALEVSDLFAEDAADDLLTALETESDDVMADLFGDDSELAAMDLEELLAEEAEADAPVAEGDVDAESRLPIAIADLPAAAEPAGDTEPDLVPAETEPEATEATAEIAEPTDAAEAEPFVEPDLMNSQVQGSLPDWLIDDDDAAPDSIGWMEAIGDSSVTDWLTAEEESLSSTFEVVDTDSLAVPGTGPLDERKVAQGDTGPLDASRVTQPATQPVSEPAAEAPAPDVTPPSDMDVARLEAARAAVRSASFDEALAGYTELLQQGEGLNVLIGDLRELQQTQPNALLVRLLGDVYMRDGQLQNALDSYRQALDLM